MGRPRTNRRDSRGNMDRSPRSVGGADMATHRAVLAGARIRLAPESQPLREAAIDRMVMQALLYDGSTLPRTVRELQDRGALTLTGAPEAVRRADLQASLDRLVTQERVVATGDGAFKRYALTADTAAEVSAAHVQADQRMERVLQKLFRSSGHIRKHKAAFVDCICAVFGRLGERYVRLLKGDLNQDAIALSATVSKAIEASIRGNPTVDPEGFTAAVYRFFRDPDPDFDVVKWIFAQNYYVAKAIGLDPAGFTLSKEVFGNSVVYLDTNVLMCVSRAKTNSHFGVWRTAISDEVVHRFRTKPNSRFG